MREVFRVFIMKLFTNITKLQQNRPHPSAIISVKHCSEAAGEQKHLPVLAAAKLELGGRQQLEFLRP